MELNGLKEIAPILVCNDLVFKRVGSYQIDPDNANDLDILVYDPDFKLYDEVSCWKQWYEGGSDGGKSEWVSFKNTPAFGDITINVLLTANKKYYDTFLEAQAICEEKMLTVKEDRIRIFNYMFDREGVTTEAFVGTVTGKGSIYSGIAVPF